MIRLGLPDSGLTDREERLVNVLAPLVKGFDLCLAPWDYDMHPDHEAAGRVAGKAAAAAGAVYSFPIWMWHWASPADRRVPWDRAVRLPLSLLSWDAMPEAVASARSRTECPPGVLVEQHVVPGEWPTQSFEVHEILARDPRLARLAGYRDPDFTAEVYTHSGGDMRSVAQADGIV